MHAGLKEEFRQQRRSLFGHRRYWLHVLLWILVVATSYPYAESFSRGFLTGVSVAASRDSTDSRIIQIRASDTGSATGTVGNMLKDDTVHGLPDPASLRRDAAVSVAMAAVLVYSFLLFVIPYARYRRQKRVLYIAFFLLAVVIMVAMIATAATIGILLSRRAPTPDGIRLMTMVHLMLVGILLLLVLGLFFSLYYFLDLYDQQKALDRYSEVFTARMAAETSFLKMQINPHFLFNSLNNIYALTLQQSPQAPVIARRLKELVSYMLEECAQETVPLSGELSFLRNYITLEQLRNDRQQVRIDCEIRGDAGGLQIAPLLLVNFIENAFKHGVKAGVDQAEVRVRVDLIGRMLSMEVFNTKPGRSAGPDQSIREAGGIGIRNVRRRLQILYPKRHTLRINDAGAGYTVHLNVRL